MKYPLTLALVLAFGLHGAVAADGDTPVAKTLTEPWDVVTLNKVIDQTNFIVGDGCSGTLISLEYRLILTNHHCITSYVKTVTRKVTEDGEVVEKKFEELRDVPVSQTLYADFREVGSSKYLSQIVAKDKTKDLALLQIRTKTLPYTEAIRVFSPARGEVRRGDKVYVIGNPVGFDATIMTGIISSVNRLLRVPWADNQEVPFFQTDAGITGGNSGGALLNAYGDLIGIPAAAVPGSVVGFALPYTLVTDFLTNACYEEVWNDDAEQTYEECDKERTKEEDDKDTVKDLLRKLIDKQDG